MTKRNLFRIAAAALLLGYLGYMQLRPKAGGHAAASRTLLPAVATNAPRFTLGTLEFSRCELAQKRSGATTTAYCAAASISRLLMTRCAVEWRPQRLPTATVSAFVASAIVSG